MCFLYFKKGFLIKIEKKIKVILSILELFVFDDKFLNYIKIVLLLLLIWILVSVF